jgi:hypothetical protein
MQKLQGSTYEDFKVYMTDHQATQTVNDTEDKAWEETMSDERFEPQPYTGREI